MVPCPACGTVAEACRVGTRACALCRCGAVTAYVAGLEFSVRTAPGEYVVMEVDGFGGGPAYGTHLGTDDLPPGDVEERLREMVVLAVLES